jgi:rhodanese-related sulfurtransferase
MSLKMGVGYRTMNLISREELKALLESGADFKLVNCLETWMFRAKRIPGSIHFESLRPTLQSLDSETAIVVYCSNPGCTASEIVYQHLIDHGFKNTRRYAGGVADWEDAGYPLEGERIRRVASERKVP